MSLTTDERGLLAEALHADHMCEPPWPAASVGLTWTCPECGFEHESMLVSDMQQFGRLRLPKTALIEGSIGWYGSRHVTAE